MYRRRLLQGLASAATLSVISGCSSQEQSDIDANLSIQGEWPLHRFNSQNIGSPPDAVGPSSKPSIEWSSSFRDALPTTYLSVIDDRVLAAQNGRVYVFDLKSGSELWKRSPSSGCYHSSTDFSPVAGGNIYQTLEKSAMEGGIIAYSAETGRSNWEYNLPDGGNCHGAAGLGADSDSIYFVDSNGYAYSISKDGEQQWRVETAAAKLESDVPLHKPPITGKENVYLYLKSGVVHAFNKNDGSEHWTHYLSIDHGKNNGNNEVFNSNDHKVDDMTGGIALKNDIVCFSYRLQNRGVQEEPHYSKIKTLDRHTGDRLWELNLGYKSGDGIPGTPVIFDGSIYIFSNNSYQPYSTNLDIDDNFNLMSISLDTGDMEWVAQVGDYDAFGAQDTNFTPLVTDQHIYVAAEHLDSDTRRLVCLERTSGNKMWDFITEESIAGPPVASNNKLIVPTEGDQVMCLKS